LSSGSSTDTMAALKAASYKNTATIWHRHIGGTERLATGWLSTILVPDPGGATPAFKEVSGVTVNTMSTTGMNTVLSKNGSVYVNDAGLNMTFEGKSAQGQFIDTTRGLHWLEARIKEALIQLFASSQVVPFTDAGVEAVKNAIRGVLGQGVTNGFLSEDVTPVVTAPSARSVSSTNRANRRLPDVRFTAALAGAIHGLENAGGPGINGVIQV
ncbi:MAG TPA: DUF3383 family protein, partial [Vicinamibacterales bacterium]|nr:DUF3383 family protein [Vicinamibacterales bacterium]